MTAPVRMTAVRRPAANISAVAPFSSRRKNCRLLGSCAFMVVLSSLGRKSLTPRYALLERRTTYIRHSLRPRVSLDSNFQWFEPPVTSEAHTRQNFGVYKVTTRGESSQAIGAAPKADNSVPAAI